MFLRRRECGQGRVYCAAPLPAAAAGHAPLHAPHINLREGSCPLALVYACVGYKARGQNSLCLYFTRDAWASSACRVCVCAKHSNVLFTYMHACIQPEPSAYTSCAKVLHGTCSCCTSCSELKIWVAGKEMLAHESTRAVFMHAYAVPKGKLPLHGMLGSQSGGSTQQKLPLLYSTSHEGYRYTVNLVKYDANNAILAA